MAKFSSVKHGERKGYLFQCPGCKTTHIILTSEGSPRWGFNDDVDNPTVTPSILVRAGNDVDGRTVCHSFVKNGSIQFLGDCTHELAGQTVPLPEWE